MEKIAIEAKMRSEKPNQLRLKGMVPAVVYGKGFEALSIEIDAKKISTVFSAGSNRNALITLNINDSNGTTSIPVLAHEMQLDAMNDVITHIDFLKLNMEAEIKTKIQISVIGESLGVKLDGGILVQSLRQLEVKCLPADIPEKIVVDVTELKLGESIHVAEIVAPKGVTIITPKEESVVTISMPTKEEEVAPVAEAAAVVGGVAEGGAAPAAGEAAPAADGKAAPEADSKAKSAQKPAK